MIDSPQKFQYAAITPTHEVAGAVQPSVSGSEGIRDEALGGQLGPSKVTTGHSRTADVQLARHTLRQRAPARVQDVDRGVRDRPAD